MIIDKAQSLLYSSRAYLYSAPVSHTCIHLIRNSPQSCMYTSHVYIRHVYSVLLIHIKTTYTPLPTDFLCPILTLAGPAYKDNPMIGAADGRLILGRRNTPPVEAGRRPVVDNWHWQTAWRRLMNGATTAGRRRAHRSRPHAPPPRAAGSLHIHRNRQTRAYFATDLRDIYAVFHAHGAPEKFFFVITK